MRKISLLFTVFLFISLSSCDYDSGVNEIEPAVIKNHDAFLKSYYSNSFSKGNSLTIKSENFNIIEVNGKYQKTPIGYIVEDEQTQNILYFVDVNVEKDKIVTIDFTNNQATNVLTMKSFLESQKIESIDTFSFLKIVGSNGGSSNGRKRPFIGTVCQGCNSLGYDWCCSYVFWIRNGCGAQSC